MLSRIIICCLCSLILSGCSSESIESTYARFDLYPCDVTRQLRSGAIEQISFDGEPCSATASTGKRGSVLVNSSSFIILNPRDLSAIDYTAGRELSPFVYPDQNCKISRLHGTLESLSGELTIVRGEQVGFVRCSLEIEAYAKTDDPRGYYGKAKITWFE